MNIREINLRLAGAIRSALTFLMVSVAVLRSPHVSAEDRERGGPRPSVVIISKGSVCPHCVKEVEAFAKLAPQFRSHHIPVTFVISQPDAAEVQLPYKVIVDPDARYMKNLAKESKDDHGTFVLDASGIVVWSRTGKAPFAQAELVLARAIQTDLGIEVQINDTESGTDDYLTWAPTRARIRMTKKPAGGMPVKVVLTNDPEKPVPPGRTVPLDGNLVFKERVNPGETATQPTLELSLPADGSWKRFYVAGSFLDGVARPSSADKDAVLQVHLGTADGPVLTTLASMVRVRKNFETLTPEERNAFLKAIYELQNLAKNYERYPQMHHYATKGKVHVGDDGLPTPGYWPDQAHAGPGFLPWHRAFLLQFERDLQKINPAVTIPYWRQNVESTVFNLKFMGKNKDDLLGIFQTEVLFSPANWLYGWSIAYEDLKTVVRSPKEFGLLRQPNGKTLAGDTEYFPIGGVAIQDFDRFAVFSATLETDPHNRGHALIGAWHANCLISPADPSFWIFHAEDDRLWAMWQWYYNRFETDGMNETHYSPPGSFVPDQVPDPMNARAIPALGHYLADTMWPWDGTKSVVVKDKLGRGNRPDKNPFSAFPKAPYSGLWPEQDAKPTPADMIDYLGISPNRLGHGFCYDTIPFGMKPNFAAPDNPLMRADILAVMRDVSVDNAAPFDRRVAALRVLASAKPRLANEAYLKIVTDRAAPPVLRREAIIALTEANPTTGLQRLFAALDSHPADAAIAREAAIELAPFIHLAAVPGKERRRFHATLMKIADDTSDRRQALRAEVILADMGDFRVAKNLWKSLADKTTPLSARAALAQAVIADDPGPLLFDMLKKAVLVDFDEETAIIALRRLAGHKASHDFRLDLVTNNKIATQRMQHSALRSVMRESPQALRKSLDLIEAGQTGATKLEASGAFRIAIESQQPFPAKDVAEWRTRVQKAHNSVPAGSDLRQSLAMGLEVLDRIAKPAKK